MSGGAVVWFTGLPASGKSTLARRTRTALIARGLPAILLDGDDVRAALVPSPGYGGEARDAFYATLANLAALLAAQGVIVLVAATAHKREHRARARAAASRFLEVHVQTSAAECAERDPKGLYARARAGGAADLPGVGVAYEPPESAAVVAEGGRDEAALARILALLD